MGCAMDPQLSWITYWYQVLTTCLFWVLEYYLIPTVIVGALITGATVIGFYLRGQSAEVRTIFAILWGSLFGLVACCAMFLILVVTVGPYLHLQQREKEVKGAAKIEYETMEQSKNDQIKTLNNTVAILRGSQETVRGIDQMAKDMEAQKEKVKTEKRIAKLCFYEPSRFQQKPVPSSERASSMLYRKQVDIWLKKGTEMFKVYTDTPIVGEVKPEGLVGITTREYAYIEYQLKSSAPRKNPFTISIFNTGPFEVLCIDQVPKRFRP